MSVLLSVAGVLTALVGFILGIISGSFWGFITALVSGILGSLVFFALGTILDKQAKIEEILFHISSQVRKQAKTTACPACGQEHDETLTSCPHCGHRG